MPRVEFPGRALLSTSVSIEADRHRPFAPLYDRGRPDGGGCEVRNPRFPSSKFSRPGLVPCLVPRSRLFAELDAGSERKVTVVVGAPGTGKTTLLAEWLAQRRCRPAAWLTCDVADREPVRFLVAVIEAMARGFGEPALGASARQLLAVDRDVSIDALAALADDLEDLGGEPALVIDDFHLVRGRAEDALRQFVEYRPPSLQIVVASRSNPNIRLQRMRAHEEVAELHDRDLAFSIDETQRLLTGFGLELAAPDVERIQARTEGWPAGVQMAAISMQATAGVASPGPDLHSHTIAGYFLEEVLDRQPPHVAEFMLATSVLDELSYDACAALVGGDARDLLDHLYTSHLFVTACDERGELYRYHQLVKEVLRKELHRRHPDREVQLHEAAALHFAKAGHAGLGARHLLAAGSPDRAFALLADNVATDVLTHPTTSSPLDLDDVRPEEFAGTPEVLVPLAAELLWRGAFNRGARAVALAQRCAIDEATQPRLALQRAVVTVLFHTLIGEFDEAVRQRDEARPLEEGASGGGGWITAADTTVMFAHVRLGDFDTARAIARRLADDATGAPHVEVGCTGMLSQAAVMEGRLEEAGELAERSLIAARRLGFDHHFFMVLGLLTTSQLALERRELEGAASAIEDVLAIVNGSRPLFNFLAQLQRARIWAAGGSEEAALASLPAARAALKSSSSIALAEAGELEARLRLRLGDHKGAQALAARLPDTRRAVTSAIVAFAAENPHDADRALKSMARAPTTIRLDVERQLLQAQVALAFARPDARRLVQQALNAAQGHGFHQLILDTAPQLVDDVIANPDEYSASPTFARLGSARLEGVKHGPRHRSPIDPLTETEIRVLTKLAEHASYADVAAELYVSLNTIKTHLRHAYTKLGVKSRSAAIARAKTLGLM